MEEQGCTEMEEQGWRGGPRWKGWVGGAEIVGDFIEMRFE